MLPRLITSRPGLSGTDGSRRQPPCWRRHRRSAALHRSAQSAIARRAGSGRYGPRGRRTPTGSCQVPRPAWWPGRRCRPGGRLLSSQFSITGYYRSSSDSQVLGEPHAILVVAVVSGRYRDAIDFLVAWLDAETHLLVEPHRALVHRGRHRADQAGASCLDGGEELLVEPSAQPAATFCRVNADEMDISLARAGL